MYSSGPTFELELESVFDLTCPDLYLYLDLELDNILKVHVIDSEYTD